MSRARSLVRLGGDVSKKAGGAKIVTESRAVVRTVEPGSSAICAHCGAPVKFVARAQLRQVIANVYVNGAWDRVEHYHADCYEEAGEPYGSPNSDQGRADQR